MDMEPTYFLYSGKLFHAKALESLAKSPPSRAGESQWSSEPESQRRPRLGRADDPSPEGREGETVGEETVGEDERTERVDVGEDVPTLRDPFCAPVPDHSDADSAGGRDAIEPH
jgi:hypothetical protein